MGMYTEFHFRAPIKKDAPIVDWLADVANPEGDPNFPPYMDGHSFFLCNRWRSIFWSGGAVYQYCPGTRFTHPARTKSFESAWLGIHTSLKNYSDEIDLFLNWISPHVDGYPGDFLGYSLYEEAKYMGDGVLETPTLHWLGGTK